MHRLTHFSFSGCRLLPAFLAGTGAFLILISQGASRVSLQINFDSSVRGISKVYYRISSTDSLSELNTVTQRVVDGANKARYVLPHVSDKIRWDPAESPGNFIVREMAFVVMGVRFPFPLPAFEGCSAFQVCAAVGSTWDLVTHPETNDPSVSFSLPSRFKAQAIGISSCALAASLVGALSFLLLGVSRRSIKRIEEQLPVFLSRCQELWRFSPHYFALALLFNFYSLANFQLSIDDEMAAFRTDPTVWISQGRWAIYWLERLFMHQPCLPFLPHALFCAGCALAYPLVLRAHHRETDGSAFLLFPFFCAFPTWFALTEFYANTPAAGLGLLATAAAVYFFERTFLRSALESPAKRRTLVIAQVLSVATSIAFYQTFLVLFCMFVLGTVVTRALQGEVQVFPVWKRRAAAFVFILLSSYATYYLVQRLHLRAFDLTTPYLDSFNQLDLLKTQPLSVLERTLRRAVDTYRGARSVYGSSWNSLAATMSLGGIALITARPLRGQPALRLLVGTLSLMLLAAPFAMDIFSGGGMPFRTRVGIPYAVWWTASLFVFFRSSLVRFAATVAVMTTVCGMLYTVSIYSAGLTQAQVHDRHTASAIYERLAVSRPDFDKSQQYRVDFFGKDSVGRLPYPQASDSVTTASFFDWDNGNATRIVAFMRLSGYGNISEVSASERDENWSHFLHMPAWPAQGSVQWVGNIALIKLGSEPGETHRALVEKAQALAGRRPS